MAAQSVEDAIIALIGSGQARTRADIVKRTGLAASTISAAVSRLVDSGAINETWFFATCNTWVTRFATCETSPMWGILNTMQTMATTK